MNMELITSAASDALVNVVLAIIALAGAYGVYYMARAQELEVHPGAVSFYGHNGAQTERSLNPWTPRQGGAARHP